MFALFFWSILIYVVYKFISKHSSGLAEIFSKIVNAFKDKSINEIDESQEAINQYESGSEIPENVRKDILNKRYLFMFEDSKSPVNKDDSQDNSKNASKQDNSKKDEDYPVRDINAHTVFADKNGEVHTLLDLASAPVNQSVESKRKISYARTRKTSFKFRESYKRQIKNKKKPEDNKHAENTKAPESNQTVDWVNQVRERLKSRA